MHIRDILNNAELDSINFFLKYIFFNNYLFIYFYFLFEISVYNHVKSKWISVQSHPTCVFVYNLLDSTVENVILYSLRNEMCFSYIATFFMN